MPVVNGLRTGNYRYTVTERGWAPNMAKIVRADNYAEAISMFRCQKTDVIECSKDDPWAKYMVTGARKTKYFKLKGRADI